MCKTGEERSTSTEPVTNEPGSNDRNQDVAVIKNDQSDLKAEELEPEHYPWWCGGGIKPRNGADLGVFEKSLEDRANLLSRMIFAYLNPLLALGSRKVLDAGDVGVPSMQDRAETAYEGCMEKWEEQLRKCEEANKLIRAAHQAKLDKCTTEEEKKKLPPLKLKEPSIFTALFVSFGPWRIFWAMIAYLVSALLSFAPVLILKDLVSYFEFTASGAPGKYNSYVNPWVEVIALGILPVITSILQNHNSSVFAHCGVYIRAAVSTMLYRKALRVSGPGRAKTSTGQVVNMMSNDTTQLQRFMQFAGLTFVAPVQMAIALWLIYRQVRSTEKFDDRLR